MLLLIIYNFIDKKHNIKQNNFFYQYIRLKHLSSFHTKYIMQEYLHDNDLWMNKFSRQIRIYDCCIVAVLYYSVLMTISNDNETLCLTLKLYFIS